MDWGKEAERRLNEIATCSAPGPGVTRFPFTPEHAAALDVIRGWMTQAGLSCHMDAAATLIGRSSSTADAPAVLIGSHQDSVREGGRYDGIMGVLIGCLALEQLAAEGVQLPFPVDVLAFADEEGVRFPTALLGPRALTGQLDPDALEMTDADGVSLREALAQFGGDPDALGQMRRPRDSLQAYLEIHIEQGPVLQRDNVPCGIVTGICGIERNSITFSGETGHAGTVPMQGRRDALVAAADFIARVHDTAAGRDGLRATVGTLNLKPAVVNAIPREAELTLEIRALSDEERAAFAAEAQVWGTEIAAARGTAFSMSRTYAQPAVPCAPALMGTLEAACRHSGIAAPRLPSGATHDASAMAALCETAMLFVRCRDGISHRPEEFASAEDMAAAVQVTCEFLKGRAEAA